MSTKDTVSLYEDFVCIHVLHAHQQVSKSQRGYLNVTQVTSMQGTPHLHPAKTFDSG